MKVVRRIALWSGLVYFCRPGTRDHQRARDLANFGTFYGQRGWKLKYRRAVRRMTQHSNP